MANIEKIVLPDNTEYNVKDANALPKTAGADEPLTGNLHIITNPEVTTNLYFKDSNGNIQAMYRWTGQSTSVFACTTDTDATPKAGLLAGQNSGILFSNSNNVYLRPNGSGSSTGQVAIDTSGQQIGGHPLETKSLTSATSLSANTMKSLLHFTGLASAGVYLVSGVFEFTPSSNTSATITMSFNSNQTNVGTYRAAYPTSSTTTRYVALTALYTGVTQLNMNVISGVAGSAGTGTTMKLVRLA